MIKNILKNTKHIASASALASALALLSPSVMATPGNIVGELDMAGSFFAIDATGGRTSDATAAVGIDFDFFGTDRFRATSGTGEFSALAGQMGDISDFTFAGFSSPIEAFWSIDIFSFELTSIIRETSADPAKFLRLSGEGIISAAGHDDTFATWSFAGTGSGSSVFSWTASAEEAIDSSAPPVPTPAPGILALLSIGLIGMGISRKQKQ